MKLLRERLCGSFLCAGFIPISIPHVALFFVDVYLRPPGVVVGQTNVHDAGTVKTVGGVFSGVRLFFVSRLLKPAMSTPSIVFHAFTVAVNSLQPDSHVSTSALVGGMSMPFCESGARTVLNVALMVLNASTLPGARPPPPPPNPPPPPRPPWVLARPNAV